MALDRLFHPESVAFVGFTLNPRDWGSSTVPAGFLDFGFTGKFYLVSRSGKSKAGVKSFTSLSEVPGTVDFVVCNVPARAVNDVLGECATKGVRFVHIMTSGFSETGSDEGRQLEAELLETARSNGIHLVGPNCPGIFCSEARIAFSSTLPMEKGGVGWFAQSGGHLIRFMQMAGSRGVRFSKAVGIGNAIDLDANSFMEYFSRDEETKIICCYVEGLKDGRRFLSLAEEASRAKPVIILKGGTTVAGARAAVSHTGSMAGDDLLWDALCNQAGIVRVYSIDEMVDTILPFVFLPPLRGRNVAVLGYGGGIGVQAADDCERAGLRVPPLPAEIKDRLASFTPAPNNSVKNPVDSMHLVFSQNDWIETVQLASSWEVIDLVIFLLPVDMIPVWLFDVLEDMVSNIIASSRVCAKPAAVVLHDTNSPGIPADVPAARKRLIDAGFPVFGNVSQAAWAISRCLNYYGERKRHS